MSDHKRKIIILITLVLVLILAGFDIILGSVFIPPFEILKILSGMEVENASWVSIVQNFRLPRVATAMVVGAGLSVSGLQMQALFRNPLAGPYVLGISSGASLGVALVVLAGITFGGSFLNTGIIVVAAIIGSFAVFLIVFLVAIRVRDSMTLLIFGLMFGSATSAVVSLLQYFSKSEDIKIYLIWTFGNLGSVSFNELIVLASVVIFGLILSVFQIKPLNSMLLGEDYSQSMGINIRSGRLGIILSAALLAGSITAFCGPIAFIGIAVPHFSRLFLKTSNHKILIPMSILSGMAVLLFCDIISQVPGSSTLLPLNAVTAIVGAPVVIWVVLRGVHVSKSF